jgi:putative transcriptional regulator
MKTLIAQFRHEAGLTQEMLAAKVGVTRQTIISLEQGRYNPSLRLAHDISLALKRNSVEEVFILD